MAVRLLVGSGGMGKTRLLLEWVKRLQEAGEPAGFVRGPIKKKFIKAMARADRAVVVVDYAETREGLGRLLSIMLSLNLVLFLFNLLPLPPMDGASVLAGLFEPVRRLRERLRSVPQHRARLCRGRAGCHVSGG